jgi:hypothetical protein
LCRGAGLAAEKRRATAGGTWLAVGTPPSRGIGGTLPGRILCMWNVGTPSGSGHGRRVR